MFSLTFKILCEKVQAENLQNNPIQTQSFLTLANIFSCRLLPYKGTSYKNVDEIFSLILINCNIILETKAK